MYNFFRTCEILFVLYGVTRALLASPIDENMIKALSNIMVERGVTAMFTGISNIHSFNEYQSMEGVPISNICISLSAELNATTLVSQGNGVVMNANGSGTVVPYNSACLPFTCYKKEGVEMDKCGPLDNEFVLSHRTGSCYKVFEKKENWYDAFEMCAKEGGHLAIINSEAEAEVIWELAKNSFKETTDIGLKYVSIGFRGWHEPLIWITVHGQTLKEAGYAKWAIGQPSHPTSEFCGSLYAGGEFSNGVLNDATCTFKFKFICEIEPKIGAIASV